MKVKVNKNMQKQMLLIIAAILFAISFATSYYMRANPSIVYEEKRLQKYIHSKESDFQSLIQDTSLIRHLIQKTEPLHKFEEIVGKDYGIYLVTNDDTN